MRITLLVLGSFFSACTYSGVYKCTDIDGKTNYQAKSCDPEHKTEQINVKTGSAFDDSVQKKQDQALVQQELVEKLEQELLQKQTLLKQDARNESAKNQFLIKNNSDKFSVFSIPPYLPDQLPDLIKNYQNRLPDIERLRRIAAEKALATNLCIRVEASELHDKSSKKTLVFLVNCSNGKSYYFTEHELSDR